MEIIIPFDSQIALYSLDVYWKPWSLCITVPYTFFLLAIASFSVSITSWLLLNLNILDSIKTNLVKLGNKNVLLIDYKANLNNLVHNQGRVYVFLSKCSILVYMFKVESITETGAQERMLKNIPLFDGLVAASKITY